MNSADLPAGAKRAPVIRKSRASSNIAATGTDTSSRSTPETGQSSSPVPEKASGTTRARKGAATSTSSITIEERRRMVEVCAYFLAEQRGFAPGSDQQDWLEAEARVEAMLARPARRTTAKRATQ